jgi:hypothetical protein
VRSFDELNEEEREGVTQQGEEEDGFAPSNDRGTPYASQTNGTFWIIQEAVDATVGKFRRLIEEEVTEEPAELA